MAEPLAGLQRPDADFKTFRPLNSPRVNRKDVSVIWTELQDWCHSRAVKILTLTGTIKVQHDPVGRNIPFCIPPFFVDYLVQLNNGQIHAGDSGSPVFFDINDTEVEW